MNEIEEIEEGQESQPAFNIKEWLFKILAIWPWIILSIVASLVAAFLYLKSSEPLFMARALVIIKDEAKGGGGGMDNVLIQQLGLGGRWLNLDNEILVLKGHDLMKKVVKETQLFLETKHTGKLSSHTLYGDELSFTWEFEDPDQINNGEHWVLTKDNNRSWQLRSNPDGEAMPIKLGSWIVVHGIKCRIMPNINVDHAHNEDFWGDYDIVISTVNSAASKYENALSVKPLTENTALINLSLSDKHPQRAIDALNSLITNYNEDGLNDKNLVAENTMEFLTRRLETVEDALRGVESQVAKFKSANGITEISANAQSYMAEVSGLEEQRSEQQTRLNVINLLEDELRLNQDNPKLVPSTLNIGEPSMQELIARHNELILMRDKLAQTAGPINPGLIDLKKQVQDVRLSLMENVKNLRNSYKMVLQDLDKKNNQLLSKVNGIPELERRLLEITRDQSVKEQLYLFLLQKREEAAVTLASAIPDSRTIETPRSIGKVFPNDKQIWSTAWMLGLIAPIGFVVLREILNTKVGNSKEVTVKTKVPLLGEVSFIKNLDNAIPVLTGGRSIVAEQFRTIRTAVSYTGKGKNVKTILVTSHRPGEGKSFTSLNLAAGYALLNKKVVILEFDLRKPRLTRNLGLDERFGISNYLVEDIDLNKLLIPIGNTVHNNFMLLPAGPVPPNPAELILGERMHQLMTELREQFDYIILDTPPFSIVTDATLLQNFADVSIVVLRQGYTFKSVYEELNTRLRKHPEKAMYAILNGVGASMRYAGYGYGYGYGYSAGYYEESSNKRKRLFGIF